MSPCRSSLLVAALGLVACGRTGDTDKPSAPAARGAGFAYPEATIEFHEGYSSVSSQEHMLVTEQKICLQTRAMAGQPAGVATASATSLAGPRRRVRAYYGGDRMAWFETALTPDVNDESCAIDVRVVRRVLIARGGEAFMFEADSSGAVQVERYPVEAVMLDAPRDLAGGKLLRRVAGADCVTSPAEAAAASAGVEGCYWNQRPPIRDAGFGEIPLFTRSPGFLPDDPPVIWEATEILTDPPPAAAFDIPPPGQWPDARFFPRGAP